MDQLRCLKHLSEHSARAELRTISRRMGEEIESGSTLTEAVSLHHRLLRQRDVLLIRTGEMTGRLDECLVSLADQLERDDARIRKVMGLMILPMVVIHLMIPMMNLPELFQGGSRFVSYGFAVLRGFAGLYGWMGAIWLGWVMARKHLRLSQGLETLACGLPLLGTAMKKNALARFCRNLYFYLNAGIPVLKALPAAGEASGSPQIQSEITRRVSTMSEHSASLASVVAHCRAFDPDSLSMLEAGERSGDIDRTLQSLADLAESQADRALDRLASWGPKLLYFSLGIAVILRIFQYMMAYMNFLNEIIGS